MDCVYPPHFVIFPFMAKGHTIPLLHLSRLLSHRGIAVTIFTTISNSTFIRKSLVDTDVYIFDLLFPESVPGIPAGVESTDQLPSMSLFIPFISSTKLLQPDFERALGFLPSVSCIISDGFLGWTLESAKKLNIPRLVFTGMSNYTMTIRRATVQQYPDLGVTQISEPLHLKSFPLIKISKDDIAPETVPGIWSEVVKEQAEITSRSWGIVFNTFYELEQNYLDYWKSHFKPRAFCLGPLCLAEPARIRDNQKPRPGWLQWLDIRLRQEEPVLYVAFGSQSEISPEQLRELAAGLENSMVSFLWVVRSNTMKLDVGFYDRVKDRGLVVTEWVDQIEILEHEAVKGFMSHCGWNSILESISASVPILAWPIMADQFFNAKFIVEDLNIALRVKTSGSNLTSYTRIESMVKELMVGEKGKEAMNNVKNIGATAKIAVAECGSSSTTLDLLIKEVQLSSMRVSCHD